MGNRTTEKISLLGLKKNLGKDFQAVSSDTPVSDKHRHESRPQTSNAKRRNSREVFPNSRLYKPPEPRTAKSPLGNEKSPNRSPQRLNHQASPVQSVFNGPLKLNNNTLTKRTLGYTRASLIEKKSESFKTANELMTRSQKSPVRFRNAPNKMPRFSSSAPAPTPTRKPDYLLNTPSRLACEIFMGLGDKKKKRYTKRFSPSPRRDSSQGSVRTKSANKGVKGPNTDYNLDNKRLSSRNFRSKSIHRNRSVSSKRLTSEPNKRKRVVSPFLLESRQSTIQLYNKKNPIESRCATPAVRHKSNREKELKEGRLVIVKRGKQGKADSTERIINYKDEPETAINSGQEIVNENDHLMIDNEEAEIIELKPESSSIQKKKNKKRSQKHKARREIHDKEVAKKDRDKSNKNKKMSDEHSEGNDVSDPSECLAEFLSAIMQRRYDDALRYCKLILRYEPDNVTAMEFYPLLAEKLKLKQDETKREDTKSPERIVHDDDSQLNLNTDKEDNSSETSEASSVLDEEWPLDLDDAEKSNTRTNSDSGGEVDTDNNPATDVEDFSDDNGNVVVMTENPKRKSKLRVINDNALILKTAAINYQGGDNKVPQKSDYEEVDNIRELRDQFLKA